MSDYQREWQQYKRRRNQFWLVFASYIRVCLAVTLVSIKLFRTLTPAFFVAFACIGLFTFTGVAAKMYRRPPRGKCIAASWSYDHGLPRTPCRPSGSRTFLDCGTNAS